MAGRKSVKVKCKGTGLAELDKLKDFQGKVKTIPRSKLDRLKQSITTHGFKAPFFVWEERGRLHLIDGHQRRKALIELRDEGWEMPELPFIRIEASSKADAAEKLMLISSQYGEINPGEVLRFAKDGEVDLAEVYANLMIHNGDEDVAAIYQKLNIDDFFDEADKQEEKVTMYHCPHCDGEFQK